MEITEDVKVYGNTQVGSVAGINNGKKIEATIDHVFNSARMYNYKGEEEYGDYTGLMVGQQTYGGATKRSVYSGQSKVNSFNIMSGTEPKYQKDVLESNICLSNEIDKTPNMMIAEYNFLLGTGSIEDYKDIESAIILEEDNFNKCGLKDMTSEQRRVSYLAKDEINRINIGEISEETTGFLKNLMYYKELFAEEEYTSEEIIAPPYSNPEKKLIPKLLKFTVWEAQTGYDVWHVEKATDINYATYEKSEVIEGNIDDNDVLSYGYCWNKIEAYPPTLYSYEEKQTCLEL